MTDRINTPATPPAAPGAAGETQPSLTSHVSGIVGDLQTLIRQEVQLARTEVKQEWGKAKAAAGAMAVGAALSVVGGFLLCFFLVYLLHEPLGLPLWGSFLIVGGVLALFGLLLLGMGYAKASRVNVVPPQTAQTMKENVRWLKNQT
jgi:hypothetical protein